MLTSRLDFTNDGKEPFKKLVETLRLAVAGGVFTSTHRFMGNNNIRTIFKLAINHVFKWTAVTTTFTTTVLFLTDVRKKDDPWNYFFAANASCGVLYSVTKQARLAFGTAIFASVIAALFKSQLMEGYDPLDFSEAGLHFESGIVLENSPDVRYIKKN